MKNLLIVIVLSLSFFSAFSQEKPVEKDSSKTNQFLRKLEKSGAKFKESIHDVSESGWNSAENGFKKVTNVMIHYSEDSVEFFKNTSDSAKRKISKSKEFVERKYSDSRDFMKALGDDLKIDLKNPDLKILQAEFDHDFEWPNLNLTKKVDTLTSTLNDMARDKELGQHFIDLGIKSSVGLMDFAWEILTFRCSTCNIINSAQQFYSKTKQIYEGYKPKNDIRNLWGAFGDGREELKPNDYWDYTGFVFKTVLKVYFKCGIPGVSFGGIDGIAGIMENISKLNPNQMLTVAGQKAGLCLINGAIKNTMKGLGFVTEDKKIKLRFKVENLYNIKPIEELGDLKKCFGKKVLCIGNYKTPNFKNLVYDLSKDYFKAYMRLRYSNLKSKLNYKNWFGNKKKNFLDD